MPLNPENCPVQKLIVCTFITCEMQGSKGIFDRLKSELEEAGNPVELMETTCLSNCGRGPNMLTFPEGILHEGMREEDVSDIITYAEGGKPVTRLTQNVDPKIQEFIREVLVNTGIDLGKD